MHILILIGHCFELINATLRYGKIVYDSFDLQISLYSDNELNTIARFYDFSMVALFIIHVAWQRLRTKQFYFRYFYIFRLHV